VPRNLAKSCEWIVGSKGGDTPIWNSCELVDEVLVVAVPADAVSIDKWLIWREAFTSAMLIKTCPAQALAA